MIERFLKGGHEWWGMRGGPKARTVAWKKDVMCFRSFSIGIENMGIVASEVR